MGKPAARAGDWHECPMVESVSGKLHLGGSIVEGNETVLIGGKPAATVGDACMCVGGMDTITSGSTGVFIGGKPAARRGDGCAHGGIIMGGLGTVLIGERGKEDKKDEWKEPSTKEKVKIINQTIKLCVEVLESKLKSMLEYDRQLYKDFEKWFGVVTKDKRDTILKRIRRTLDVCKDLRIQDFELVDVAGNEDEYGSVYREKGDRPRINLGVRFWKIKNGCEKSRAGVVIHELSHFKNIGKTDDYAYGIQGCLGLAEHYPNEALYNADSYELFIRG